MMDQVTQVVRACVDAIGAAGDYYGLRSMRVDTAGRLKATEGARSVRLKVRMVYERNTGREVREAMVVCVVLADGTVKVLSPDEAYTE